MGVKIRRLENNLVTLGAGIIAFGLWSVIKFSLTNLMMGKEFTDTLDNEYRLAFNLIGIAFIIGSFLIYLWIGLSARAEGKGKRKKIFYLIAVVIIIIYSILMILYECFLMIISEEGILSFVVAMIVDGTRTVFLIELLYSSITLRRLKKQRSSAVADDLETQGGDRA